MQPAGRSRRVPIPRRLRRSAATTNTETNPPVDRAPAAPSALALDGDLASGPVAQARTDVRTGDVAFALSRAEAAALRRILVDDREDAGSTDERWSVTPDGLRAAIETAADHTGTGAFGAGAVEVLRLPGALHSPEVWHVRLSGAAGDTATRLETAVAAARRRASPDVR